MAKGATIEQREKAASGNYLTLPADFCSPREASRYIGGNAFARMRAIASDVSRKLADGVDPSQVLVFCASPAQASAFRHFLPELLSPESTGFAQDIRVCVPRDYALDILGEAEAQKALDRTFPDKRARLLSGFEVDFLMEDLKTFGTPIKRLREELKFILRGWSELADEGDCWLVTVEETEIVEFVHDELRYLQGILEQEVTNFAGKAVRRCPDVAGKYAVRAVYALDYQNMSRATQLLCNVLAKDYIAIAGDADESAEVYETYPYLEGMDEFLQLNAQACTIALERAATLDCATANSCAGVDKVHYDTVVWDDQDAEIGGLAARIAEDVAQGLAPEEIGVVDFHQYWHAGLRFALGQIGVPCTGVFAPLTLRGDIRDLEKCVAQRMVTVLRLLANPRDSMSWRCWIGYGDYLTNSQAVVPARKRAQEEDRDVTFAAIALKSPAATQIKPLLDACEALRGRALLQYLADALSAQQGAEIPEALKYLGEDEENATPAEMLASLDEGQFFADFAQCGGVKIGSPAMIIGQAFTKVYLCGFVDGLFPKHVFFDLTEISLNKQAKLEKEYTRQARALVSAVTKSLVVSRFERCEQSLSERCDLYMDRIYIEDDGTRYGRIRPSYFTPALEQAIK